LSGWRRRLKEATAANLWITSGSPLAELQGTVVCVVVSTLSAADLLHRDEGLPLPWLEADQRWLRDQLPSQLLISAALLARDRVERLPETLLLELLMPARPAEGLPRASAWEPPAWLRARDRQLNPLISELLAVQQRQGIERWRKVLPQVEEALRDRTEVLEVEESDLRELYTLIQQQLEAECRELQAALGAAPEEAQRLERQLKSAVKRFDEACQRADLETGQVAERIDLLEEAVGRASEAQLTHVATGIFHVVRA